MMVESVEPSDSMRSLLTRISGMLIADSGAIVALYVVLRFILLSDTDNVNGNGSCIVVMYRYASGSRGCDKVCNVVSG